MGDVEEFLHTKNGKPKLNENILITKFKKDIALLKRELTIKDKELKDLKRNGKITL